MLRTFLRRVSTSTPSSGSFFKGVYPIMATPFHADGSLDLDGFARSLTFMHAAGSAGVTITGVLGESNRLTDTERADLVRVAVDAAAACSQGAAEPFRVCVGTSHAGTAATAALSKAAMELGADAVMVTPTKEAAPTPDDMLVDMYAHVAKVCPGLPIVLQDHPASTQVHMSVPLLARIAREVPSVSCIKLEALPTPAKIAQLRKIWAAEPQATECTILTGLGALYGGFDLEQGTEGVSLAPLTTLMVLLTPPKPSPLAARSLGDASDMWLRMSAPSVHDGLCLPGDPPAHERCCTGRHHHR